LLGWLAKSAKATMTSKDGDLRCPHRVLLKVMGCCHQVTSQSRASKITSSKPSKEERASLTKFDASNEVS
jgi:hypothetical protein